MTDPRIAFYTTAEVARVLRVSEDTIRRKRKKGTLPFSAMKIDGMTGILYPRSEVDDLIGGEHGSEEEGAAE